MYLFQLGIEIVSVLLRVVWFPDPSIKPRTDPLTDVVRLETQLDLKKGALITCILPKLSVSNSHTSATK